MAQRLARAVRINKRIIMIFEYFSKFRRVRTVCLTLIVGLLPILFSQKANASVIYHRERGLEVHRGSPCRAAELLATYEVGLRRYRQGQFRRALEMFQSYRKLAQTSCDKNYEQDVIALNRIGLVYEGLGQYEKARESFEQANLLQQENEQGIENSFLQGVIRNNLGLTLIRLGEPKEALEEFKKALNIHRQNDALADQGTSYTGLGLAYLALERYSDARYAYERAQSIFDQVDVPIAEGIAWNGLGNAYAGSRQYNLALNSFAEALSIYQDPDINARALEGFTRSDRGATLIAAGQLVDAETELLKAIGILESLREDLGDTNKISIFETQATAYQRLQYTLVAQNKFGEALEISERGRSRAFVEQLTNHFTVDNSSQDISESSNNFIDLDAIKDIAKEQDATLVSYSINRTRNGSNNLYIWVIQPNGEMAFQKVTPGESNLDQPVALEILSQLDASIFRSVPPTEESSQDRGGLVIAGAVNADYNVAEHLKNLHKLLIEPINHLLPSDPNKRVIFVPQGGLFLVPFPALRDENGTYLIEKHTILTTPSIHVLGLAASLKSDKLETQRSIPNTPEITRYQELLIVGNPTMPALPDIPLAPLPGAEKEAKAVANLLNAGALIGQKATEATVKSRLPNASIIHFATHGLLEYGLPEDSGVRDLPGAIALTPDTLEDGLLTSFEISNLTLQADLAVLSACDTGLGRITGDGVIGLSRSLITAGVPSVVVSLWSVPDAPTAELMTEFYRQLQNNSDKAQALRQAMLQTLKTHPHPRDWAAFTLIGSAQ